MATDGITDQNTIGVNQIPGSATQTPVENLALALPQHVLQQQLHRLKNYYTEYFSGAQVKVYVNDVRLNAVTIAWTASQNKIPVYGYASQEFDAVMKGNFLVNGELSIAFRDVGEFHAIDKHIKEKNVRQDTYVRALTRLSTLSRDTFDEGNLIGSFSAGQTPLIGYVKNKLRNDQNQLVVSNDTIDTLLSGPYSFEEIARTLEEVIWGIHPLEQDKAIIRADQMDFVRFTDRNGIPYTSIADGLNFLITYGNVENPDSENTVKSINDIHFIGSSQSIDPSSGFIIETYTFFAKSMDRPTSNIKAFAYGYDPTSSLSSPNPQDFAPITQTFSIDITTGIDPETLMIEEASTLSTIESNILALKADMETKKSSSGTNPNYSIKTIVLIPKDWTQSDSDYTTIRDRNPAVRKQILRGLANKLISEYIQPALDKRVTHQIVESGGLVNTIQVKIEVS